MLLISGLLIALLTDPLFSSQIKRNLAVREITRLLVSSSIDGRWQARLMRIEQWQEGILQSHRFLQWKAWLEERERLLVEVQANNDIRATAAALLDPLHRTTNDGIQGLPGEVAEKAEDIEVKLALANVQLTEGNEYKALAQLTQVWQKALSQNAVAIPFEVEKWRLEGFTVLPLSIEQHPFTRLILFWRDISGSTNSSVRIDAGRGLYGFKDKIIQIQEGNNLLPLGDMNFSPMVREQPLPYPWKLYPDYLPDPTNSVQVKTDTDSNSFLSLESTSSRSLVTFLPLVPETQYLLIGNIRSSAPGFYMVMENVKGLNQYPALIAVNPSATWQRYSALFEVQPSEYFPGLYLGAQPGESGTLDVDQLGVFQVQLPD